MRTMDERDRILSPRAARVGLLVVMPLIVVFGVQAISWAVPKTRTHSDTATAVAVAAEPLHTWSSGETLQARDLNGNFSNLQSQISGGFVLNGNDLHNANPSGLVGIGTSTPSAALDVTGQVIRKITRVHGNGPNDTTASG